ncbi:hypothetical protein [Lacticaseibacillus saniviri]|uniref:HicB-like antitoxin of toxin-antitoxin system domain-containing protein n=1 Tax=Lacticaseibacillus saniviri JCM 17471 = DSM 24301 TaxID=1293598 RepID=A0A0R2MUY0_9LACO|nr:hypothetical protein [Lacticaseibacillus saniviri]KRO16684.1 hypothetical protein IV56_GL000957 [Lacticaseibacillus saniviri JCM 17471 = DSM 24301]MCG4282343.1 hypothetical protein [Lacticaseibacillus saniviri]
MQEASTRRLFFVSHTIKTDRGYSIKFPNIPNGYAKGTTYEETLYYAYRVLSDFLSHLPKDEVAMTAYTLRDLPEVDSDNDFYALVSVPENFDPHQMRTYFTLPQVPPAEIRQKANAIAKIISNQEDLATL